MCSDLPATEERLIPVLIPQSMVHLYDPTAENNAIGANAAHALTLSKTHEIFYTRYIADAEGEYV